MGLWIIIAVIVLGLIAILIYNRLVGLRQNVRQGWADIDAQLRQRHDLIPNLVSTVQGYATHEKSTLDAVISARQRRKRACQAHSKTCLRLPKITPI
jgi:LemA protein